MTELSGNKRRVHTRHEAHGSVSVSAVVLPAGANAEFGQCSQKVLWVTRDCWMNSKRLVGQNT
jgi:hypothetical protein